MGNSVTKPDVTQLSNRGGELLQKTWYTQTMWQQWVTT